MQEVVISGYKGIPRRCTGQVIAGQSNFRIPAGAAKISIRNISTGDTDAIVDSGEGNQRLPVNITFTWEGWPGDTLPEIIINCQSATVLIIVVT